VKDKIYCASVCVSEEQSNEQSNRHSNEQWPERETGEITGISIELCGGSGLVPRPEAKPPPAGQSIL
jgi:hypothetical protein